MEWNICLNNIEVMQYLFQGLLLTISPIFQFNDF